MRKYVTEAGEATLKKLQQVWGVPETTIQASWHDPFQGIHVPGVVREDLAVLWGELGYSIGAEVGVERGKFSEVICRKNPNVHLWAVDLWRAYSGYREHVADDFYASLKAEAERRLSPYAVRFMQMESKKASRTFVDKSLDFVYLDANHELPYIVSDIAAWLPKIRPGGMIAGHDYSERRVSKRRGGEPLHVIDAVKAWTRSYRVEPWFVLGSPDPKPGERAETYRSWCWVVGV